MDILIRLFRWDDLAAVVEVTNASADVDHAQERYDADSMRDELTAHNDPEQDCYVAVTPDGTLIGHCYVEFHNVEGDQVWGFCWGSVHPDYRRQGIGTRLLHTAEARFETHVREAAVEPDRAVLIQWFIDMQVPSVVALAQAEGYKELRGSYRMSIPLDQPLDPVPMPAGFTLRPFDPARDAQAAYEVDQTSFMDGGGQVARMDYEAWRKHYLEDEKFDPALWLLAYDGDTAAGLALSNAWGRDDPELGWVGRLGVLRPYRG
ncbi:MAG TPA: GNAT family N-acetyltransferase, partial [Aggregatilineaceae bacterium]|nr:GNAT family N-acetyltransferase [Aggregatilineaceae bacterium]